jgi:hypothetical protein
MGISLLFGPCLWRALFAPRFSSSSKMSGTFEKSNASVQHREASTPPTFELYRHTFFSKEAATARKALVPTLVVPLIYNAILLLACLSLFFGSLLQSNDISRIVVAVVNLDDGFFGSAIISGIQKSLEEPGEHLQWHFLDQQANVDDAWSRHMVLDEKFWAVLQVSSNASSNLDTAREQGNSAYNPQSAMTLYFTSARNQVTTLSLTIPTIMGLTNEIISKVTINTTASYLQSNAKGIRPGALDCPQCLTTPFGIRQIDLIPFTPAVAFGTLNTGMIFVRLPPSPPNLSTNDFHSALNLHIQHLYYPPLRRRNLRPHLHTPYHPHHPHPHFASRIPIFLSNIYLRYPRLPHSSYRLLHLPRRRILYPVDAQCTYNERLRTGHGIPLHADWHAMGAFFPKYMANK